MSDATPDSTANMNGVLIRQLAALLNRVGHQGHGTPEGRAIAVIRELWDLDWDIVPRLDNIGAKRERARKSER